MARDTNPAASPRPRRTTMPAQAPATRSTTMPTRIARAYMKGRDLQTVLGAGAEALRLDVLTFK